MPWVAFELVYEYTPTGYSLTFYSDPEVHQFVPQEHEAPSATERYDRADHCYRRRWHACIARCAERYARANDRFDLCCDRFRDQYACNTHVCDRFKRWNERSTRTTACNSGPLVHSTLRCIRGSDRCAPRRAPRMCNARCIVPAPRASNRCNGDRTLLCAAPTGMPVPKRTRIPGTWSSGTRCTPSHIEKSDQRSIYTITNNRHHGNIS